MGLAAIVLGILSLICAIGGFMISFVPGVGAIPGAMLTLGAPLLALIGMVLGGVALSRARSEGGETGLPMAGLIVSVVAFFPAFFIAITCGLCDMMCASAQIQGAARRGNGGTQPAPWYLEDGGLGASPGLGPQPIPSPGYPDPNAPSDPLRAADDPAAGDPAAGDPAAGDPAAGDPVAGEPEPSGDFPPPPGQTP